MKQLQCVIIVLSIILSSNNNKINQFYSVVSIHLLQLIANLTLKGYTTHSIHYNTIYNYLQKIFFRPFSVSAAEIHDYGSTFSQ